MPECSDFGLLGQAAQRGQSLSSACSEGKPKCPQCFIFQLAHNQQDCSSVSTSLSTSTLPTSPARRELVAAPSASCSCEPVFCAQIWPQVRLAASPGSGNGINDASHAAAPTARKLAVTRVAAGLHQHFRTVATLQNKVLRCMAHSPNHRKRHQSFQRTRARSWCRLCPLWSQCYHHRHQRSRNLP